MPATIWDAALDALAARLAAETGLPVDKDRRAPVDASGERRPRYAVALGEERAVDYQRSPGEAMHMIAVVVQGFATARDDTALRVAINELDARAMTALIGMDAAAFLDVLPGDGQLILYDAADAATPAGEFTRTYTVTAFTPAASPYAP